MIDEIKLFAPKVRKLKILCHHKQSGRVVHPEGEELAYVMAKLGFKCTNNGQVMGTIDTANDTAKPSDAAPAEAALLLLICVVLSSQISWVS